MTWVQFVLEVERQLALRNVESRDAEISFIDVDAPDGISVTLLADGSLEVLNAAVEATP